MKNTRYYYMKIICLILVGFFISIISIAFINKVLVEKMALDEAFVSLVNDHAMVRPYEKQQINWQKLYPFEEDKSKQVNKLTAYKKVISSVKEKITDYSSSNLLFYQEMIELEKRYEQIVGKLHNFNDNETPLEIDDNYFVRLEPRVDVKEKVAATVELANFCSAQNINFLFVQPPTRLDLERDARYLRLDNSIENVNAYLAGLSAAKVDQLDTRESVAKENINVRDLFFGTDHHWRPEAGLWSTRLIAQKLNRDYGYTIDTTLFDRSKYNEELYEKLFLGAYGRRVTLVEAEPEDIILFYPKFKTAIDYQIPEIGVEKSGDFSVTYDMSAVSTTDFYNHSVYAAYNYSERAIIRLHNTLNTGNNKLMIVKDSFADVVAPFLALGVKDTCVVDLRFFDGSLHSLIKDEKPDTLIVLYSALELVYDDRLYDFR